MAQVTVLFFGGLRDALACSSEQVSLPSEAPCSLADVYGELCSRHPRLPAMMASVRLAHNEEFLQGTGPGVVAAGVLLRDGDVVAFIPPVTGG